jgi:hypothetical protein
MATRKDGDKLNPRIGDILIFGHLRWEVIGNTNGLLDIRQLSEGLGPHTFQIVDSFHSGWKIDETSRVESLLKEYEFHQE